MAKMQTCEVRIAGSAFLESVITPSYPQVLESMRQKTDSLFLCSWKKFQKKKKRIKILRIKDLGKIGFKGNLRMFFRKLT